MSAVVSHAPLRLSSVLNACPRKAVYEATDAPAREPSDREQRIRWRGKRIGEDYADLLAAKYGEHAVERERKVVWPLGVGHEDAFLKATKTVVEVLSSAHASEQMVHGKLLQLTGYIEHDPAAENGVLVIVSPTDFSEERIVVNPNTTAYKALVEEMLDRVAEVLAWRDTGELPVRVCAKPSEAKGRFCLHADHCFGEDWQPPPLEQVAADETTVLAVTEYDRLKRAETDARNTLKAAEDARKEQQAVLEALELPAGRDVQVGAFKVRRTFTERAPSFDWKKAELAGVFDPELFGEYMRPGAAYSTFRVERVDHAGDEYGDGIPWEDGVEGPLN